MRAAAQLVGPRTARPRRRLRRRPHRRRFACRRRPGRSSSRASRGHRHAGADHRADSRRHRGSAAPPRPRTAGSFGLLVQPARSPPRRQAAASATGLVRVRPQLDPQRPAPSPAAPRPASRARRPSLLARGRLHHQRRAGPRPQREVRVTGVSTSALHVVGARPELVAMASLYCGPGITVGLPHDDSGPRRRPLLPRRRARWHRRPGPSGSTAGARRTRVMAGRRWPA